MWEFMTNYADHFYAKTEQAGEIIRTLWAWVMTLIPMVFVIAVSFLLLQLLYWEIEDKVRKFRVRKKGK